MKPPPSGPSAGVSPPELSRHGPPATDGRLIYAVGDLHGRLDLLDRVMAAIGRDARKAAHRPVLVFLGDYIDRGAQSKGVIDRLIELANGGDFELRALKGNHEEALLKFVADGGFGPKWCDHGGEATLASYGVAPPRMRSDPDAWSTTREAFMAALPQAHLGFFNSLELSATYGEYLFVHAGVRPDAPLAAQAEHDLLWIRAPFLDIGEAFEKIVVHGHTPQPAPHMGDHRIGIDTGAYASGLLTAVRLEGAARRFIQAAQAPSRRRALPAAQEAAERERRFKAKADHFKRAWTRPAEA